MSALAEPVVRATFQQRWAQRMWEAGRAGGAQVSVELFGPLDARRLRAACESLVARHELLGSFGPAAWSVCDLTAVADHALEEWRERCAEASRVRFLLLRTGGGRHDLVVTFSPLVADAGTLRRCAEEILDEYDGGSPEPGLAYAEVAAWQEELQEGEDAPAGRRYWDRQAPRAFEPKSLPFEADAASAEARPRSFALEAGGVLVPAGAGAAAFWLVCWQALLYRLSNGTRFVTGFTASPRRYAELQDVVGPLDRALPVACLLRGRDSVARAAASLDERLQEHLAWQEYYADGGAPLWHVGFAHHRWPAGLARPVVEATGAPLALVVHEGPVPHLRLHYDASRFDRARVGVLARRLRILAADAAARPHLPVEALALLTAEERAQIVEGWNATAREWRDPAAASLLAWIEAQASRTPEATAVWSEGEAWTYTELHARANRIARRLQRLGAGQESRVGVWVPRSPMLVGALLGVVKSGAAYVPLDPAYPAARLAFQLGDAQVGVVLTTEECAAAVPPGPYAVEVLDGPGAAWPGESPEAPPARVSPDQLAYVIYTSGSTGQPKGAMNTHRGIANRLAWMQETYKLGPADRVLQKTSCSFDVSVWEFFWPLGTGASIVVAKPGGQHDPSYLAELIATAQVTVLHFVPAMLEAFAAAGGLAACAGVRLIVSSGEALPSSLVERCRAAWPGRLDNLYGPTEAAVDVTWHPASEPSATPSVPIGRPIANTQVYVREGSGEPSPVGMIGELYLGGVQVGRGYWSRPDLTAERFVPDPFGTTPGGRLYRTGDLARYGHDGRGGVHRARRSPGQAAREPDRAGGDRGGAAGAAGSARRGGAAARGRTRPPAPGGLRGPGRGRGGRAEQRPAGRAALSAARVHGAVGDRAAELAAPDAQRQGRSPRPPGAVRGASHAGRALRGAAHGGRGEPGQDLGRGAAASTAWGSTTTSSRSAATPS